VIDLHEFERVLRSQPLLDCRKPVACGFRSACPGTTARKLDWLASLYIRAEAYTKALAELVNHHHRHPFSEHWGEGTTSSSDGQRFRASGRGEPSGQVNLRYGNEPGVPLGRSVAQETCQGSSHRALQEIHGNKRTPHLFLKTNMSLNSGRE